MSSQTLPKARQLTAKRLREVIDYDPKTGVFTWKKSRPGCVSGRQAGTLADGYRQIEIDRKLFRGARLAWLYVKGDWPPDGFVVDHKNGVRDDDRWCNLRIASYQQNARNRATCRRNKSGKVGVCLGQKPGTWAATITINNRTRHLGQFECKEAAVTARCKAEKHYFGDFARRVQSDG